ncbi:MAG: hypothetical protein KDJ66_13125, partial [Nitratireductor sp.]|nr:hypothetical protein [Nitratireductor sp.]
MTRITETALPCQTMNQAEFSGAEDLFHQLCEQVWIVRVGLSFAGKSAQSGCARIEVKNRIREQGRHGRSRQEADSSRNNLSLRATEHRGGAGIAG